MEFNPHNTIVQLCLQGMFLEDQGKPEEALRIFLQAWDEAGSELEKFLAAHYVSRHQKTLSDKLLWTERALHCANQLNNDYKNGVLPSLYSNLAKYHAELGDTLNAQKNAEWANSFQDLPLDQGPFYHGTKAELQPGDLLSAGARSNYQEEVVMNHIYFTALLHGAGLAADLAKGDGPAHVYIVEPTGIFENDPNLTDKKFPGNPTRSFRSQWPLKIVGEISQWNKLSPEEIQKWREKLANHQGEIIN